MATAPKSNDNLRELLRDVAFAFIIVIVGFLLAGVIAEPFRNLSDLAYPIGLCIGLVPFWWFTRRCQIHNYDVYDYVAASILFLTVSAILLQLVGPIPRHVDVLLTVLVLVCFFRCWSWARSKFSRDHANKSA